MISLVLNSPNFSLIKGKKREVKVILKEAMKFDTKNIVPLYEAVYENALRVLSL